MSTPTPDWQRASDLEGAWSHVRWYIEATVHQPTLMILACNSARDEATLRDRVGYLARRLQWPLDEVGAEALDEWAGKHLPYDGIVWFALRTASDDLLAHCLTVLNRLRTRLAHTGAGCVVLAGDGRLVDATVREAPDLWSTRTLVHRVQTSPTTEGGPAAEHASESPDASPDDDPWRHDLWSPPSLTVPVEYRNDELVDLIASLEGVYRALPGDLARAARLLDAAGSSSKTEAGVFGVMIGLARMYLLGAAPDRDVDALAQTAARAIAHASELPLSR